MTDLTREIEQLRRMLAQARAGEEEQRAEIRQLREELAALAQRLRRARGADS